MACLFYSGVTGDLIKRRDVYKNYKKREYDNLDEGKYTHNKNIHNSNESKKIDNNNFNNKKIISDDIDEFYYDEEQFNIHSKINKEQHPNSFNAAGYHRRSTRNRETNIYREVDVPNVNISVSNKTITRPTYEKYEKYEKEAFVPSVPKVLIKFFMLNFT